MSASPILQQEEPTPQLPDWASDYLDAERGLLERLEELPARVRDSVEFVRARDGGWSIQLDGVGLTSSYAPLTQAQQLIAQQNLEGGTLITVLGAGAGVIPVEIYKATREANARIMVVEPHPGILRQCLLHNEELSQCDPERLKFFTNLEALKLYAYQFIDRKDTQLFVCPPHYARSFPNTQRAILTTLQEAVSMANINRRTALVRTRQWVHNLLENSAQTTRYPSLFNLRGAFEGVPAVLLAAGPSLDKNLALLAPVQDKVLVICVNTSLKAALAAGIKPDLVMSLEGLDVSSHFAGVDMEGLNLALSQTCHPVLYQQGAKRVFTFMDGNPAHLAFSVHRFHREEEALDVGGCIANGAFSAAAMMGCEPIILLGQDLAYTEGQVYAKGTVFEDMRMETDGQTGGFLQDPKGAKQQILDASEIGKGAEVFEEGRKLIAIDAWGKSGKVWTSMDFNLFRYWFQEAARGHKETRPGGATLINATEGGAHIDNFEHRPLSQAIEAHIQGAPSQDYAARIAQIWSQSPRLAGQTWRQGVRKALQSCTRLGKQSALALQALKQAQKTLERKGSQSPAFEKALRQFTREESRVARISRDNVLVNAYLRASIREMDIEGSLEEGTEMEEQWKDNLKRSWQVLEHVQEASTALHKRIRGAVSGK